MKICIFRGTQIAIFSFRTFFLSATYFRRQHYEVFFSKKIVKWKQVKITNVILQRPQVLYKFGPV